MKRLSTLILFNLLLTGLIVAQQKAILTSPRTTIRSHLSLLPPNANNPTEAAKTINESNPKKAKELAVKLKQYLDGEGYFVHLEDAPSSSNYIDSVTGKARYGFVKDHPEIYVEKVGSKWLFSEETAHAIPKLYDEAFPWGSDFFRNLFPVFGSKDFLGLKVWQYIGIFFLTLVSVILHKLLTLIIRKILGFVAAKANLPNARVESMNRVSRPLSLMVITVTLTFFTPMVMLPIVINKYVMLGLNLLTRFFIMMFFYRLVDLGADYFERFAEKTENTLDDQLVPLIRKVFKIFVVVCGVIVILQGLDYDVTALIAGLSIGGLAFALAAQDTIKNLFGSLMIFVDKPFQVGDWINFDGVDGTVEEVGFRSTRVRTFANSLVYVPNGHVADTTVDNMGMRVYRRFKAGIGVTYDTPPDLLEQYVEGLKEMVEAHPQTRKDYYEIHVNSMSSSSIDILFYIFFEVPDWSQELKARQDMILGIMRLAENLGINFAFPTQTLHVENFPGNESLSAVYEKDAEAIKKSRGQFLEDFKQRNPKT